MLGEGIYQYAEYGDLFIIKLGGRLIYSISSGFEKFLNKLFEEKKKKDILIDLSTVEAIDSTNLGLLAKIAIYSIENFSKKISIISTNDDVNIQLRNMGFDDYFIKPVSIKTLLAEVELASKKIDRWLDREE